jgi:hypothetical protein
MNQAAAFWVLSSMCESLIPENYSKTMIGSLVDQQILEDLLALHLPNIHKHLVACNVPIGVVSQPWFLCLFIGYLPLEVVLNILDCFFFEGPNVILAVALAIFKLRSHHFTFFISQPPVLLVLKILILFFFFFCI